MHPVLFEIAGVTIYSYGLMIALGAIAGVWYMSVAGKREVGLTFDQSNSLFLYIFIAAFVGGKAFLFFEGPVFYSTNPATLLTGKGFVFYGSFLFAIPTMFWFFKNHKLSTYKMLDVMAVTTCLVHMFGRLGCFLAGCCYGKPTENSLGVIFAHPACSANPKGVPLHPTQLYEASFIFFVMVFVLWMKPRRTFYGQLFLLYLILYAVGRFFLEFFRGDVARGFIIEDLLSHSQLIGLLVLTGVMAAYISWSKRNKIAPIKKPA